MKDPVLYLIHIRDCSERVLNLGAEFRTAHPEIPWRGMIDARNILIPACDQVSSHLLRDIIVNDLPDLIGKVQRLIDTPINDTPQ